MKVKIKKLSPDAMIPTYKHDTDAGFDLTASHDFIIHPGETKKIPTGLAFDIPKGYEMQIRPRSGLSADTTLRVILGTIDSGYHGEVSIIIELEPFVYSNSTAKYIEDADGIGSIQYPNASFSILKGTRIAQAVIAPVTHAEFEQVDELGDSERGNKGFGSTGTGCEEHD